MVQNKCPLLHLEQENTKHDCNQINKLQNRDQSIKEHFQTECEMIELILNQVHEQHHDPIKHLLDQVSSEGEDSNHPSSNKELDKDDNELLVSTSYNNSSMVFEATAKSIGSLAILMTSSVTLEAQEIVLAQVILPENVAMKAMIVSMSQCCLPVFHMLQVLRTKVTFWTQFLISTSKQWPRTHFRTKAFQTN